MDLNSLEMNMLDMQKDFEELLNRERRRREDLEEIVFDLQKQVQALENAMDRMVAPLWSRFGEPVRKTRQPNWRSECS